MIFEKVYIYLPEFLRFCSIFAGVKRLKFASKDAEHVQSLGGTALGNSRDMQMQKGRSIIKV